MHMFTLNCKGRLLVADKPIVMGIINATPDSFYAGSRKLSSDKALQQAEQMLKEGATIVDIGGQSTRPGSTQVSAEEELERVLPVIESIHETFPDAFISIDTYYSAVAAAAVQAGACIVNDVSGGLHDEPMLTTVAALQVPYICMHMKGRQEDMQHNPVYDNVTKAILDFLLNEQQPVQRQVLTM